MLVELQWQLQLLRLLMVWLLWWHWGLRLWAVLPLPMVLLVLRQWEQLWVLLSYHLPLGPFSLLRQRRLLLMMALLLLLKVLLKELWQLRPCWQRQWQLQALWVRLRRAWQLQLKLSVRQGQQLQKMELLREWWQKEKHWQALLLV